VTDTGLPRGKINHNQLKKKTKLNGGGEKRNSHTPIQTMQITIYYTKEDKDLMAKIEAEVKSQRKSRGAFILSILEDYFQKRRRLGGMLRNAAALSSGQLDKALEMQGSEKKRRLLGEILVDEGFVEEKTLRGALSAQKTKKGWLAKHLVL